MGRSRSPSRTPSRSPSRTSETAPSPKKGRSSSRSRSRSKSRRSRSASGDRERRRSRSHSPVRSRKRSRSREFTRRPPRGVGPKTAATWNKRDNPDPSRCLGVFNLSMYTTEKDLRDIFGEFGDLEKIDLVYDHPTGRSRGFGFIYFERIEDATAARDKLIGIEIDGRKIRIDFSVTKRAHSPTPGQYMGQLPGGGGGGGWGRGPPPPPRYGGGYEGGYGGGYGRGGGGYGGHGGYGGYGGHGGHGGGHSSRHRSPSPRYSRGRRSRSRSYDRGRYY